MAIEAGHHYNPDSAKDLRSERFHFTAFGMVEFRYTLEIPAYLLPRLKPNRDKLQQYMDGYAEKAYGEALAGGYAFSEAGEQAMRRDVGLHLKNYVWERFCIAAAAEGTECVQVAPSLQEVHQ